MSAFSTATRLAQSARDEWREAKDHFLASLALNAIILLPIILSIRLYLDDYPRALFGTFGWDNDARPATSIFFFLFNLGTPLVAASPLYQILAYLFLSIACTIAARAYKISSAWLGALCTLPMIGQPYFLANLSFGFDSASMALAQLLAISAAIIVQRFRGKRSFILATTLLIISLLMYQACASSFLVFALILCAASLLDREDETTRSQRWLRAMLRSLGCYVISLAIIGVYVRYGWQAPSAYAIEASKLLPLDSNLPIAILNNASTYLVTYWKDWARTPLPLLIIGLSLMLIGSQISSKQSPLRLAALLILITFFAPGASLLLAKPPADLPRTLVFVGPLLSSFCLLTIKALSTLKLHSKLWTSIALIPIGVLAWLCILVTFSYGHAAQAQREFEAAKISRLIDQVNRLNPPAQLADIHSITYTGGVYRAPIVQNSVRKFPVIDRLVFRLITSNNDIGLSMMNHYGLPPLKLVSPAPEDLNEKSCLANSSRTVCSPDYIVQLKDGVLRVRFL